MADMDVDTPAPAQEVVKKAKGKDSGKARFEVKKVGVYCPLLLSSPYLLYEAVISIYTYLIHMRFLVCLDANARANVRPSGTPSRSGPGVRLEPRRHKRVALTRPD